MATVLTAEANPLCGWQDQALAALEDALGRPLDVWEHENDVWRPVGRVGVSLNNRAPGDEALTRLLQESADCRSPCTESLGGGRLLLAMPLGEPPAAPHRAVTGVFHTDDAELLSRLATLGLRHYQQQQQVARLGDENSQFLQQITNDFEELTFLRSMAGRLNLSETGRSIHELISDAAPALGAALRAGLLYYIDTSDAAAPRITTEWLADDAVDIPSGAAFRIVEQYGPKAEAQPVIRNHLHETAEGAGLPGVREFLLAPVTTGVARIGWFLAVNRRHAEDEAPRPSRCRLSQLEFGSSEAFLLSTLGAMVASHSSNLSMFRERETLLVSVVRTLVSAVEAKDKYTCGHSERVALYARRLAAKIGYSENECELLYLTGLLHDIGKIAVSDAVLKKPGRLTDEEFAEIKRHPDEGWKILQELKQLSYVLPGVLHHHERPDGRGYPDGLAGDQVPIDGRVLAVADAYDAMTSDRAYRDGMSQEEAERVLREGAGTQWDARLVDAFFEVMPDIVAIRRAYRRREQPVRRPAAEMAAS